MVIILRCRQFNLLKLGSVSVGKGIGTQPGGQIDLGTITQGDSKPKN